MSEDQKIRERPILFSGLMVSAILENRKTQTRRVCKDPLGPSMMDDCPYGEAGERLWVRETFQPLLAKGVKYRDSDYQTGSGYAIGYVATDGIQEYVDCARDEEITDRCKPAIFMPRWASRITLEITKISVNRIQEITAGDAIAEGIQYPVKPTGDGKVFPLINISNKYLTPHLLALCGKYSHENLAIAHYAGLWDSINAKRGYGWEKNPWVWVIEFKQESTR